MSDCVHMPVSLRINWMVGQTDIEDLIRRVNLLADHAVDCHQNETTHLLHETVKILIVSKFQTEQDERRGRLSHQDDGQETF
jgi:hypothetical protein